MKLMVLLEFYCGENFILVTSADNRIGCFKKDDLAINYYEDEYVIGFEILDKDTLKVVIQES